MGSPCEERIGRAADAGGVAILCGVDGVEEGEDSRGRLIRFSGDRLVNILLEKSKPYLDAQFPELV